MAVDKDLFLYDLAVVAIMKNETPYVKEWLDYHILAGVDHFYIYDNETTDNFKEVLQPYIDAGIVTYKFYPGAGKQVRAYNDAFKNYKFFCRYMFFIDADEFIFPQNNKSVVEVADEIFNTKKNLGGVEVNWIMYDSNNLEEADYSKGVLERFTRRAAEVSDGVKTISNPRKINYIASMHYFEYYAGVSEILADGSQNPKGVSDKIVVNHYWSKSKEEFLKKIKRGNAELYSAPHLTIESWRLNNQNDFFDDGILKYRDERKKICDGKGKQIDYEKLVNALIKNLAPILSGKATPEFFEGKMETFLTCRALATFLKETVLGNERGELVEKAALQAIYQTSLSKLTSDDVGLFISELPNILQLNYPEVKEILHISQNIVEKMKDEINLQMDSFGKSGLWRDFNDADNLLRMLQVFDSYSHK